MTGIIGILLGFMMMIFAFFIESGYKASAISHLFGLTPAMIVFGGTIGAVMVSFPIEDFKKIGKVAKIAFTAKERDLSELVVFFKELAFKTRKNGLLSIEGEIAADEKMDPFIKKGLQMIVDGVEPQAVRGILELEADMTSDRHKVGAEMFAAAGGYSPTMGIIGTVMGLVNVLGGLASSSPEKLGESIATAFIATLYGVAFANLVYLPLASRLKEIDKQETTEKNLVIEAILFIQEGVNPNTIAEKLKGFLNKNQIAKFEALDKKVEA